MNLAIIGSGISGLATAWVLPRRHAVTLVESEQRLGGHTCTVSAREGERTHPLDIGFMVFNNLTYPNLTRLFAHLSIPTRGGAGSYQRARRSRGRQSLRTRTRRLRPHRLGGDVRTCAQLLGPDAAHRCWPATGRRAVRARLQPGHPHLPVRDLRRLRLDGPALLLRRPHAVPRPARHFQDDLALAERWKIDGRHCARTLAVWLARLDANRPAVRLALSEAYGLPGWRAGCGAGACSSWPAPSVLAMPAVTSGTSATIASSAARPRAPDGRSRKTARARLVLAQERGHGHRHGRGHGHRHGEGRGGCRQYTQRGSRLIITLATCGKRDFRSRTSASFSRMLSSGAALRSKMT